MTAYALWTGALWQAVTHARRAGHRAAMGTIALAAGVTVQACLGILTLVFQVPPLLALLHQAMAIVVLGLAVVNAQRLWGKRPRAIVDAVQSLASTRGA
jgi:cytochrome c oxidase assembly protein subunit 15